MKPKSFFVLWGPVILWCLVIFILSSIPTFPSPKIIWWDFVLKKTAHLTEYAILYFLVFRAINNKLKMKNEKLKVTVKSLKLINNKINWITPFLITIPYSISDEIHQYYIPGRHSKFMDIVIDFLGMLLAFWLIKRYKGIELPRKEWR